MAQLHAAQFRKPTGVDAAYCCQGAIDLETPFHDKTFVVDMSRVRTIPKGTCAHCGHEFNDLKIVMIERYPEGDSAEENGNWLWLARLEIDEAPLP